MFPIAGCRDVVLGLYVPHLGRRLWVPHEDIWTRHFWGDIEK